MAIKYVAVELRMNAFSRSAGTERIAATEELREGKHDMNVGINDRRALEDDSEGSDRIRVFRIDFTREQFHSSRVVRTEGSNEWESSTRDGGDGAISGRRGDSRKVFASERDEFVVID